MPMKTRINTVLGLTLAVVMFVATASAHSCTVKPGWSGRQVGR
jgi:hypothetical protein